MNNKDCPKNDGPDHLPGHGPNSSNSDVGHNNVAPGTQYFHRDGFDLGQYSWAGLAIYAALRPLWPDRIWRGRRLNDWRNRFQARLPKRVRSLTGEVTTVNGTTVGQSGTAADLLHVPVRDGAFAGGMGYMAKSG